MKTCDTTTCGATSCSGACACSKGIRTLYLPARGPNERLGEFGIVRSAEANMVEVPNNWDIVPSSVSPYHRHLVDGNGKPVCCILDKSLGGGSYQFTCSDNCADAAKS